MIKRWKWTLAAVVGLTLALTALQAEGGLPGTAGSGVETPEVGVAASTHSLLDVRVGTDLLGRPTVSLDANGEVEFESFVLDLPDRLVLDLHGVVDRLEAHRFVVEQNEVVQVRAAQYALDPIPVTRVVFDLETLPEYQIERLGASIVVVFGEAAEAPMADAVVVDPVVADAVIPADEPAFAQTDAQEVVELVAEMSGRHQAEPMDPVVESETVAQTTDRALDPDEIDRLLQAPAYAAPQEQGTPSSALSESFGTQRIVTDTKTYRGKRISLNLVDADIKQVFRLFHEISGLNFVLDPDVSGRVTIVLDQVPWDQALDIILKNNGLDKELENNVLRIASTNTLAQEAAARQRLKEAAELEVEPITLTRKLSYGKALDVAAVLQGRGRSGGGGGGGGRGTLLSTRGSVIADERTNTLIVSDIPKKIEAIDKLITVLDSETPQVMIEARIVETSKNYSRDLGVVWDVAAVAAASNGTATGLSFPHNASGRYALNLPGDGGASSLGFSFGNIVDSFTLDLALNALETEGRGRIISAPKIATQNNERAEIEQGVRIPITNTTATEIQVEFVSASLLLQVTPQITAEGTIILDVTVENNSPDFVNTAGGIPSIRTQRAQTKVLIGDGGTTVIGGIFVVNEGDSEVGVPWFRKIPMFGWLFRNQSIQKENRELLIFITPKIVKLG